MTESGGGDFGATRQKAIDALCEHFANDALTVEEFERRVDQAHKAETTVELQKLLADPHGSRIENSMIHSCELIDNRAKIQIGQNIFFQIHTGGHFYKFQFFLSKSKNAALCYIEYFLTASAADFTAESDLFHCLDKFSGFSFCKNL